MFLGVNCTINKRCFIPPTLTEPKMVDVDKMIENGKENFYPAYSWHFSGICKMQYHADISSSSGRHFLFKKRRETRLTTFFQVSDIYFRTYGDFHFFRFPFEKNMQREGGEVINLCQFILREHQDKYCSSQYDFLFGFVSDTICQTKKKHTNK